MKYIVILGDGMADMPYDGLGGKTPLEVAIKPNIDKLAQKSFCGMCKTVPDGIKPGSDVANLSVMGYSPLKYYSGRSPLEALSIGVDMADDDLAVRCNLVTLSDEEEYSQKSMVDYSAGEISSQEAAELIATIQQELGNEIFAFYSGVSYRHCLIRHHAERGTEFTPPHDISGKVVGDYLPNGLYGEEMLALMKKSYDILKEHPINQKRIEEGKNPANSIWLWGEGSKPTLPDFEQLRGLKGAVISAVDLLKGIGIASGMKVIEVEGATGTVKTNFEGKAEACVQAIRDGYDYVYLHMEAPDECGHQGDSEGKVKSIELIDEKVVGYILNELEGEDLRILVCPDHPTPLETKTHSSEPIPFLIYDSKCIKDGISAYTENECKNTGVMLDSGDQLVELFLQKEEDMEDNIKEEDLIVPNAEIAEEIIPDVDAEEESVEQSQEAEQEDDQMVDCAKAVSEDDDEQQINGNEIFAVDGKNDENATKIDPKSDKEEQKAEDKSSDGNKKNKKPMSPKQKKIVTILIAVAVLAVLITIAIVTPILVINAPKVLINSAEDFAKPVKDKKELYYLQKDVTVNGDLTLGLNVDLNKKVLTVNGTLTIDSPKGGAVVVGVADGKEYKLGGKISAKKLVVKNATSATLLTNITADEIEFDHIAKGVASGSIQANNSFNIKSSEVSFDELAFGENIKSFDAVNSSVVLNKATKMDVKLENSKLSAKSDIGNVSLDSSSELRLYGAVYNDFESKELGDITGGKLVYVEQTGSFGNARGMSEIWVTRDYVGQIWVESIHFIDLLETPQLIDLKREGASVHLELSSIDSRATKVLVNIDNAEKDLVFDIATENIAKDGGYVFDLKDNLNTVGNHSIKVVLRSANPDFVKDSEPYFKSHTHYITLDRVGEPKVVVENGEYWLSFKAVNFAESYEVVFDGVVLSIKNDNATAGTEKRYNLSADNNFKPLLEVPGNHLITIVSKSSLEGINPSEKAYAKFDAITKKLDAPTLKKDVSSDGLNYVFSWNKVDNASSYKIAISGAGKDTIYVHTTKLELVIAMADLDGYDSISIVAFGKNNYYENSDPTTLNIGLGA